MDNQKKAYLFAALSVICWSTVATAFKIALKLVNPVQLLLVSSIVSLIILFIILIAQKKFYLLGNQTTRNYLQSAALGFLNPFLYYLVLFKAYSLLPAQEAQPLNYTWGVVVALLSIPLLKQKITALSIFAIIISFVGVLVISTHGDVLNLSFSNPAGVGLAVGSSLIWSLFWILNVKDRRDDVLKLFLNFLFGTFFILIYAIIISEQFPMNWQGVGSAAYVGIFEMGITFVFWLKAMQYSVTTAKVGNLIYMSPFISLFFIHFILGEDIRISSFVGLVFIIGGLILQQWRRKV